MIEGNGPKWLFDIDSLTQSMNYVPVAAGTISNESADASYFDSSSKDVGNDEPKSIADDPKHVKDGPSNEDDDKDKFEDDSSPKEVNADEQQVNITSPGVNTVHTTPNTRIHKDHPLENVTGDVQSSVQTRGMKRSTSKQGFLSAVYEEKTYEDLHTCLFACFLSQKEQKRVAKALSDPSWAEAMQEELLQFKLQKVYILEDLPKGKRPIGMDVKGAFIYGTIKEEVYVCQPLGFEDLDYPDKVYRVVKALYGLHQAPKACQDKYVDKILRKFNYTDVKTASTPVDLEKPLVKDGDADDVDVHLYRSMIGSLMYLIISRPDIMFVVCACARFQVTPKTSHLLAVKRIFRYLKGKPTLGLWYSRDSPFELVAYTDSDYAGATQDRKSTTGGCQFLGNRLIS
ncbi:uncharacterized mitochondrial protein-like protein [Tanacetum coccineum]